MFDATLLLREALYESHFELFERLLSLDGIKFNTLFPGESFAYHECALLQDAVRCNDIRFVKLLLERESVDVNIYDRNNLTGDTYTPLHVAAASGYLEVVELLLSHKDINVNVQNSHLQTPLHLAIQYGARAEDRRKGAGRTRKDVIRALLARDDIDANARDSWNRTPLMTAGFAREILRADEKVDLSIRNVATTKRLSVWKRIVRRSRRHDQRRCSIL